MSITDRIELRRTRDFGATINVVFEFLRQNWKPLGKSLIYIMGPVLILAGLAGGAYFRSIMGAIGTDAPTPSGMLEMYLGLLPTIGLMILAGAVSLVFLFGVVAGYVRLYNARFPEAIGVDDVWREVRSTFWRITGTLFVITIVIALPMLILVVPAAMAEIFWLIPLAMMLAMVPTIYFYNTMTIVVPMRLEEEIGIFEAIGRAMKLMQGRWWFTFWIFVVMQIILLFASMIFQVPIQVVVFMQGFSGLESAGLLIYIAGAFNVIGTYLLYAMLVLTASVQYYNLVEQKEGVGMVDRINEIGASIGEDSPRL